MSAVRLLVLNQYYAPDLASTGQIAARICEGLAADGFEVTVVASEPSYEPDAPEAPSFEYRSGVEVHRVSTAPFRGKGSLLSRFGGYIRFMLGACSQARDLAERLDPDVVLTFHNPPFVGVVGTYLSNKFEAKFVYSPYDILPDIVVRGGWLLPDLAIRVWERINRHIHDRADRIIVLGQGMADVFAEEKGVRRAKIERTALWAQPELSPSQNRGNVREEFGVGDDEFLFLYSGNMGYMHAIEPLINAAHDLESHPIRFLFVGGGPKRQIIEHALKPGKLENTQLLPYQPVEKFKRLVAAADAGFVTLERGMGRLAVPSRALTFLSAGTPLIVGMTELGEVAGWVQEERVGWIVKSADDVVSTGKRLSEQPGLLREAGKRAAAFYHDNFGARETISRYSRILSSALED